MSKPIRVADYMAKNVERLGTDSVFMLNGGMMMHLMDAVGRIPAIRPVGRCIPQ
jgi:TPP-dependent 2-oxoacid decarboxylase